MSEARVTFFGWRSSHSDKQRPLLCILPHHCSCKPIPHLSRPPPAFTVISSICLCQWQVSWSCSLYSFSHKSLLIVSLEGCCGSYASPALDHWQSADLGLVFSKLRYAGITESFWKSREHYSCQSRLSSRWGGHCEVTVPRLITAPALPFFHMPFSQNCHSLKSSQNRWLWLFSTCSAGRLTLEPSSIVLTWSSSTALLGLKGSFLTITTLSSACSVWQAAWWSKLLLCVSWLKTLTTMVVD